MFGEVQEPAAQSTEPCDWVSLTAVDFVRKGVYSELILLVIGSFLSSEDGTDDTDTIPSAPNAMANLKKIAAMFILSSGHEI